MPDDNSQAAQSIAQIGPDLPDCAAGGLIYIEQLDVQIVCSTPRRPFLRAVNDAAKVAILFRPVCKTWGCPACAKLLKNRWVARAIVGVQTLQDQRVPVGFLTLTSHEKLRGAASFRVWPHAWAKLRHRYYRQSSQKDFYAVPERHLDGTLHTHAIITGDLDERWWKDNARECGMGYMADLQEVEELGVGGYVGKYLNKTLGEQWPKFKRRVNTSRGWPPLPEPEDMGWDFSKLPQNRALVAEIEAYERRGYKVIVSDGMDAWTYVETINAMTD